MRNPFTRTVSLLPAILALTLSSPVPLLGQDDEPDVNVQLCEQRLTEIYRGIQRYVAEKGAGRFYPDSLVELAKLSLIDGERGLRCPADTSPEEVGNIKVGYQSAFDVVPQKLTTNIPEVRPLVWDKPGAHGTINLVLLASGRIIQIKDEAYYREFIGGWASKVYLQKASAVELETTALLTKLRDEPESLNLDEVVQTLGIRGPHVLPELFKELAWMVPEQKAVIIQVVKTMGRAAETVLMEDSVNVQYTTRTRALELLGVLQSKPALERYTKMLDSEYRSVRLQAIDAFGLLGMPETEPILIRLLKSKQDPAVKKAAAIALAKVGGPEARDVLNEAFEQGDVEARLAVARYMARNKDASALSHIQKLIKEVEQGEQQTEVLAILVSLGSKDALRRLRAELRPPPTTPLARVMAALLTIRDLKLKGFVRDVIPLLSFNYPELQARAARTLGELGDRAALPALRELKEANFHIVRRAAEGAISTLEEFGPEVAEKELPAVGDTVVVLANQTPVFSSNKILATIDRGNLFTITGRQKQWYSIEITTPEGKSATGWLFEDKIKLYTRTARLPFWALTRMTGAKIMFGTNVVTALPEGKLVEVYQERDGWFNVSAINGKWGYGGWMAAGEIRQLSRASEPLEDVTFKLERVSGLPRFNETGIAYLSFSPKEERFAVASKGGRVELINIHNEDKVGRATIDPPVIAMAYHPERATLMVSSDAKVYELAAEDGTVKAVKTFPWLLKDLKVASIVPDQARGIFPFTKETEKGNIWRLAVEDYEAEKIKTDRPPDAPGAPKPGGPPARVPGGATGPPARDPGGAAGPPTRDPGGAGPPKRDPAQEPNAGGGHLNVPILEGAKPQYARTLPRGVIVLKDLTIPVRRLEFSPTGFYCLAVRRSMIDVISVPKMQVLGALEAGTKGVTDLAMSPNTMYVAAGGEDELVRIWETSTQKLRVILQPKAGKIMALGFAPDNQLFAVCTSAGDLQLWDLFTEKMIQKIRHQGSASALKFSPDGRTLVVGNTDSTVVIYTR